MYLPRNRGKLMDVFIFIAVLSIIALVFFILDLIAQEMEVDSGDLERKESGQQVGQGDEGHPAKDRSDRNEHEKD